MKAKFILMAGASVVALAWSSISSAQAAATTPSSDQTQMQEQVDELNQRVEALEAEVQASEQRQSADHDQIAGIGDLLNGWWKNTSISGRMYFDTSWIDHKTNGTRTGTDNGAAFDVKRFYVGIDHTFNDVFSADITTDVTFDSTTKVSQIYIKKAYLQAKLSDAAVFKIGSTDMPWIPFAEDVYGYRYVENTLSDRLKYGNSADWGVHVSGKLYDGMLNYAFSVVNGAGYKKAAVFRTNGPDFEGRVNLNVDDFILGVGGYLGKFGQQFGTPMHHEAKRLNAIAAYKIDGLHFGVEYFTATNMSPDSFAGGVTNLTVTNNTTGVSGFASYQFDPEWTVFGRYDHSTERVTGLASIPDNYFNVGIEFTPVKIVNLSLVYKHDEASHNTISTSNGGIGGSVNGSYNEVGLFGQLRW